MLALSEGQILLNYQLLVSYRRIGHSVTDWIWSAPQITKGKLYRYAFNRMTCTSITIAWWRYNILLMQYYVPVALAILAIVGWIMFLTGFGILYTYDNRYVIQWLLLLCYYHLYMPNILHVIANHWSIATTQAIQVNTIHRTISLSMLEAHYLGT